VDKELEGGERSRNLRERTNCFSLHVIKAVETLPNAKAINVLSHQILRSATSVDANYRAARVARSEKEFIAKLQIALEEADETQYWAELLIEVNPNRSQDVSLVLVEAKELTAILVSALKTARAKTPNCFCSFRF